MEKQLKFFFIVCCSIIFSIDCRAQNQKIILNQKIAESFIETLNRQDYDRFMQLFSDDASYEEVCSGRMYTGKSAIKNYIVATIEGMPDTRFVITSIVANENEAVVEWIW